MCTRTNYGSEWNNTQKSLIEKQVVDWTMCATLRWPNLASIVYHSVHKSVVGKCEYVIVFSSSAREKKSLCARHEYLVGGCVISCIKVSKIIRWMVCRIFYLLNEKMIGSTSDQFVYVKRFSFVLCLLFPIIANHSIFSVTFSFFRIFTMKIARWTEIISSKWVDVLLFFRIFVQFPQNEYLKKKFTKKSTNIMHIHK